ncbi:MAG TPA: GH92 family glycosyl hydrolase, partial [Saprospiraceae bacterium]|nr:GH92 family glycosyl hydrolase [Saprospiraceae bacterium]
MMQVRFDFAITLRICVLVLSIHGLWAQSYFPARIPYPLDQVNPFIGTGGHGHTFPGAVFPFGMMQLSPDTRLEGWDGCSGYHDTDSVIYGFSHTHLSGTGIPDYCDVLFMPGTGAVHFNNGSKGEPGYASAFKKSSETASPGFYQVELEKYGVTASLTTGKRSGMQAYRYAQPGQQWLLIDLKHRDPLIAAGFTAQSKNHIAGYRHSRSWAKQQSLFFHARFNKDIRSIRFSPDSLQLVLYFDSDAATALLAHVAISAVDAEGAEKNLMSEWNEFRFAELLQQTQMEWKSLLGRVEIEGRDSENKKIFYTSLYHTLIHPSLFQDVDGRYRGMDQKIHTAIAEDHYTVFSLWDTYRSTHPLYQWIYPEYNAKFIRTFLRHYEQSGHLPVWELAGNETWCMIGNHAIPVIANAWAHGALDFDTSLARIAVSSSLLKGSQSGLTFMGKEFISSEEESESVSKTIENSLDFAAALAMGCMDVPSGGATAYRNLYHPRLGFFQAKQNNRFVTPFDPAEVNFHFTEANAWQYLFGAHHDLRGMTELFALDPGQQDGRSTFLMKLDSLFETGS